MTKQSLKNILLLGVPLAILIVYLVVIFVRIGGEENQVKAEGVEVVMKNPQFTFVSKKEISTLLEKQLGRIEETKHDSIYKNLLEDTISKNPFVESVEIFRTASNKYRVEILQRSPMLRIITAKENYYLDKEGFRMPAGLNSPALVHIYKGNITPEFAEKELVQFQLFLEENHFWSEMLDYVEVNAKQELTLYLKAKSGKVFFGKIADIEKKFEKLLVFIDRVGKHNGLENYETIDVRFENQVVVKKK